MRKILQTSSAAILFAIGAACFTPSVASAGAVGLPDATSVAPASNIDHVYWRSYCHRRWVHHRHWACGGCGSYGYYGAAYPAYGYGYYGSAYNPVGLAATSALDVAASPLFGFPWLW